MPFGQVVIGPPGCGKTVYCNGMEQLMTSLGRKVEVVNLDPANDLLPYDCSIDLKDLITLEEAMENEELGPNGAMLFCMDSLLENINWLLDQLKKLPPETYILFDCPGQVELYTHHSSIKEILKKIEKLGIRLCSVSLIDSFHCSSPSNYISAVTLTLSTMIQLELPHVSVLSKIDIFEKIGKPDLPLEFYTDAQDLTEVLTNLNKESPKYTKLNEALCELIEGYSLVAFLPLDIQKKESVYEVLTACDRANGYAYSGFAGADKEKALVGY